MRTDRAKVNRKVQYGKEKYMSKIVNMYYGIFATKPEDKPKILMKLTCAGANEQVVVMHVMGIGSDEMMQVFGVAMKMGCTKADLDSCVAIHPTMGVWRTSPLETGAKVSPLGGTSPGEPREWVEYAFPTSRSSCTNTIFQ